MKLNDTQPCLRSRTLVHAVGMRLSGLPAALCVVILVTASIAAAATESGQCVGGECAAPPDCPADCSLSQCPCFGAQVDASNYTRPLGCVAHVRHRALALLVLSSKTRIAHWCEGFGRVVSGIHIVQLGDLESRLLATNHRRPRCVRVSNQGLL